MRIVLNGESREVAEGATVADLVEGAGLGGGACAVEVNRKLAPRAGWRERRLSEGDEVEIVTLVGGG